MIAPNDKVIRIFELVKSVEDGKATKQSIAEEMNRLSNELNKDGISDDYIERMLDALWLTEHVNSRLRAPSPSQSSG